LLHGDSVHFGMRIVTGRMMLVLRFRKGLRKPAALVKNLRDSLQSFVVIR
jgi:hypothetical protein